MGSLWYCSTDQASLQATCAEHLCVQLACAAQKRSPSWPTHPPTPCPRGCREAEQRARSTKLYNRQRQRFHRALLAAEDLEGADSSVFSAVSRKGSVGGSTGGAPNGAEGATNGHHKAEGGAQELAGVGAALASVDPDDDGCAVVALWLCSVCCSLLCCSFGLPAAAPLLGSCGLPLQLPSLAPTPNSMAFLPLPHGMHSGLTARDPPTCSTLPPGTLTPASSGTRLCPAARWVAMCVE